MISPAYALLQRWRNNDLALQVDPPAAQKETLRLLLDTAADTDFGRRYGFRRILKENDPAQLFREHIPSFTYENMRALWWQRALDGENNVAWPGKTRFFALSSGTSDSASKHIPVTGEMLSCVRKFGRAQLVQMSRMNVSRTTFSRQALMVGGSMTLERRNGYEEGDMSGISMKNMPAWLSTLYFRPGKKIGSLPTWKERFDAMVTNAHRWNIGVICGMPSWVQILLENIIAHYRLPNIHALWPDLSVYIHGGVSFDPYRQNFSRIWGKPVTTIETYMASEGSFGFSYEGNGAPIRLLPHAGIFFEFVPFNPQNFENGNLRNSAVSCTLGEVREGVDYAILISTCSGAWRYVLGDVVTFTNARTAEIRIVGRTHQFLNLCGEHVSVDNLNKAIELAAQRLELPFGEFAVAAVPHGHLFAYHWYIASDATSADANAVRDAVDSALMEINDDYRVERQAAITDVRVTLLPHGMFTGFLRSIDREGGMNKFPRVLRQEQLGAWKAYLSSAGVSSPA